MASKPLTSASGEPLLCRGCHSLPFCAEAIDATEESLRCKEYDKSPVLSKFMQALPEVVAAREAFRQHQTLLNTHQYRTYFGGQAVIMECRDMISLSRVPDSATKTVLQEAIERVAANQTRISELKLMALEFQGRIEQTRVAVHGALWENPMCKKHATKTKLSDIFFHRVVPEYLPLSTDLELCLKSVEEVLWQHKDVAKSIERRMQLLWTG